MLTRLLRARRMTTLWDFSADVDYRNNFEWTRWLTDCIYAVNSLNSVVLELHVLHKNRHLLHAVSAAQRIIDSRLCQTSVRRNNRMSFIHSVCVCVCVCVRACVCGAAYCWGLRRVWRPQWQSVPLTFHCRFNRDFSLSWATSTSFVSMNLNVSKLSRNKSHIRPPNCYNTLLSLETLNSLLCCALVVTFF